jgi:hypothetical protein
MPETAQCDPDTAHCYVVMTAASTESLGPSQPFWQNAWGRKDSRLSRGGPIWFYTPHLWDDGISYGTSPLRCQGVMARKILLGAM